SFLMRDVSTSLVPPGDVPFAEDDHLRFVDAMAGLCASTWGWHDHVRLLPSEARWAFFGPASLAAERDRGWPEPVPRLAADGWVRFAERAPAAVVDAVEGVRAEPGLLAAALQSTPSCFLHGDWKASNLGTAPDGRVVLLD